MPCSHKFVLISWSKCHPEFKHSWFCSTNSEKLKVTINVDNLSDKLWIAAFNSELHVEDYAAETSKIEFSGNKILAVSFFENLSDDILDHRSKLPFV